MRKLNTILLLSAFILLLTGSCSSTKNSKGGGWYHNRNVIRMDVNENETVACQPVGIVENEKY